jgi:hypothetical protein
VFRGQDLYFTDEGFSVNATIDSFSVIHVYNEIIPQITMRISQVFTPRKQEVIEVVKERIIREVEVRTVKAGTAAVTIQGPPGTILTFTTDETYVLDETGSVTIDFPYDITIPLLASLPDHYSKDAAIDVQQNDLTYTLKMERLDRWGIEGKLSITEGLLTLGGRFYLIPGVWFMRVSMYTNVLSITDLVRKAIEWARPLPVFVPSLDTGISFFAPHAFFHISAAAGISTKIVFPPNNSMYISRLTPFMINLELAGELSFTNNFRIFLSYTPRFIISSYADHADYIIKQNTSYPLAGLLQIYGRLLFQYGLPLHLGVRFLL